jgi:alpha,alpha-trehalase
LAGLFPLWAGLATEEQAQQCAEHVKNELLVEGGVRTTTYTSGQQWDAPNGWAPLQWVAVEAFRNTGFLELSQEIKQRWMEWNTRIFLETGKFTEKYDVENKNTKTGGGEYPNQDGFGWTNGVYSSFLTK